MTPPRLSRGHLIFGAVLVMIGIIFIFDAFSSSEIVHTVGSTTWRTRDSWFFPNSDHDVESLMGLAALAGAVIWVGGSVGWWIVRTIFQLWVHKVLRDSRR